MRQDPRMRKPFERLQQSCAAGLFSIVPEPRIARINAEVIRQRLAHARFNPVPILIKQDGKKAIPLAFRSKR
jgi:hypothetical protein